MLQRVAEGGRCVVWRSGSEQADLRAWWCVSDRSSSAPARAETFGRRKMFASRCQKPVNRPTSVPPPPLSLHLCSSQSVQSICPLLIQAVALFFSPYYFSHSPSVKVWARYSFCLIAFSLFFFFLLLKIDGCHIDAKLDAISHQFNSGASNIILKFSILPHLALRAFALMCANRHSAL